MASKKKKNNKTEIDTKLSKFFGKNKNVKNITQVATTLIALFLIIIAGGIVLSYTENPLGIKAYSVLSNSMKPQISRGSLIFTKSYKEYSVGDVITYKPSSGRLGGVEVDSVTHRIVEELTVEGKTLFITKGDANPSNDVEPVQVKNIYGKVVLEIPLIGYPIEFAKTEKGFFILIVIPAVIIIYEELKSIKRELSKRDYKPARKRIDSSLEKLKSLNRSG